MVIANVGLVVAFGAVAERGVRFVMNMAIPPGNAPVNWPLAGFVCGATMGLGLGWFSWHSLQQLTDAIGGFRSERLLLKYYDAYAALRARQSPVGDSGGELSDSGDGAESLREV